MHEGNLIRTKWCPEWGSNPHWEDFKSSASAIGLSGRYQVSYKRRQIYTYFLDLNPTIALVPNA